MRPTQPTAAARLRYMPGTLPDFTDLSSHMDRTLRDYGARRAAVPGSRAHSGDRLAIFDIDHCRIALALTGSPRPEDPGDLLVAVGANGVRLADDAGPFRPQSLCHALVEDIRHRHPCAEVIRAQIARPIRAGNLPRILRATDPESAGHRLRDMFPATARNARALAQSCRI